MIFVPCCHIHLVGKIGKHQRLSQSLKDGKKFLSEAGGRLNKIKAKKEQTFQVNFP